LVLGICNGFQVLLKAGVLPGGQTGWPPNPDVPPPATLTWNDNGKYTALWIRLRTVSTRNVFLRGIDEIDLPIAHAEGRLQVRDPAILDEWTRNEQIAVCYQRRGEGRPSLQGATNADSAASTLRFDPTPLAFPDNPNGSMANIAGLSDPTGRVLGLMPHPERFIHRTQHPHWTRRDSPTEGDGLKLFRNAVDYFGKW
jgi:phosphoribosylformylglycinamidine synthase